MFQVASAQTFYMVHPLVGDARQVDDGGDEEDPESGDDVRPPEDLFDHLPPFVSLAFYDPRRIQELRFRSPLFALHLAIEGTIIRDSTGLIKQLQASAKALTRGDLERVKEERGAVGAPLVGVHVLRVCDRGPGQRQLGVRQAPSSIHGAAAYT